MTAGRGRQLTLDLPLPEGLGLDDFLPAESNRPALDAVLGWPNWPGTALIVEGPPACGKTHLARIWAARADAVWFEAPQLWEVLEPRRRLGDALAAVVDDADAVPDERNLFHLFNILAERRGHLLLTSELTLAASVALPDLRSRLAASSSVRVASPDDGLLAAILVKQLADRQLRVEPGLVEWLLPRMERSFAAVRRLAGELDRAALAARRPITIALARAVLAATETTTAEHGEDTWILA